MTRPKVVNKMQPENPMASAVRNYTAVTVAYILLVFLLPANSSATKTYHLSSIEYHILLFAIVLPSLVVWFAAFYGYARLKAYALSIQKTPEGNDFMKLANGIKWLAWSLPFPAIVGLVTDSIANSHTSLHPATIILGNYLDLLLPLIGFSIIGRGSRGLISRAKLRFNLTSARLIVLLFMIAGVLYCFLTFRHFDFTTLSSTNNPYYVPFWLMLLTITIPFLYAWFIGLLAAYELNLYGQKVHGLLYRRPLRLLAAGLIIVIACSIALQYVNSVEPRVGHLLLNFKLILTYIFRLSAGAGYLLLALGALRLKKIEDV